MRWAGAIFALCLAVATAAGQQAAAPAGGAQPNPSDLCSLQGVVVKSTTGEGLRKIDVYLMSLQGEHQTFSAVTDSSGRFTFTGLEAGRYVLTAGGNGYPQQGFGYRRGRPNGKILTLAPGSAEKNLEFRLTPPGVITGTVSDEDGDPVVGGQVQALRVVHAGARQQSVPSGAVQTNDLGQYRIYGLEPGRYLVSASFQHQAMGAVPSNDIYLPTFYPGTADLSQATPVQVSPGDEVSGIDVNLEFAQGVTVRGRIVSEMPVKGFRGTWVSMMPRDSTRAGFAGSTYGGTAQDDEGNFEIHGVPPGAYVLFAALTYADRSYSGRALAEVGNANLDGVSVVVGPGATVRGRVRLAPGAELDLSRLSVSLQATENYGGGAGVQVAQDGTFALENLSEGTYRVNVGGFPEEFYLQSARYGGVEALETGVTVRHDDAANSLEVVLSSDGGRVDGVVLKEHQPVGGALVVLVPDPPHRGRNDLYSFKNTDPLGRFSLLGLPPGDFKLFAWEQHDGVSYTDPDFIADYENLGTHVHITAKDQQSIQLQVISDDATP
ncbi:MAG: carboxypeptidase regulatory-like domain-containing protein [Terriglobia bacterium]